MIIKQIQEKGILPKLIEKAIEILLRKECKKIENIEISIAANTLQIIKGIIRKINIKAEDINYKDILLDKVELEANDINIAFKINKKELNLKNNFIIKLKISLSETSLKTVLLSKSWKWIGYKISKGILNQNSLEDIKIKANKLFIKTSKVGKTFKEGEKIDIKAYKGKLYLENKSCNKSIEIPIEDKIFINDVTIENNLIHIIANSPVSF